MQPAAKPDLAEYREFLRIGIGRRSPLDPAGDILEELKAQGVYHAIADLPLSFCNVPAIGLEPVSPNLPASLGIDQLRIDPDSFVGSLDTSFHNIAYPQRLSDLTRVDPIITIGNSVGMRFDLRQVGRSLAPR
jgi:hypothetical protein